MIKNHQSYVYAEKVVNNCLTDFNGDKVKAPKYVKKQCKEFLNIANNKNKKFIIDENKVKVIDNILKLLIMPKGLKVGKKMYECLCDYQWLFLISIFCIVHKEDFNKRKYETAILEVSRKNFKTYTIALAFIILFLLEPMFSKFYSVAPDGALSRQVKEAIVETLKMSPIVFKHKNKERFKILRDSVTFLANENKFVPLNYSSSRFDGRLPNAFIADEVGALPNSYAIEAMRSGQLNVLNKLGCIISTKYPTFNNPLENEVDYAKKVLDGLIKDDTIFALLYEPDNTKDWQTDDLILKQANPVALEIPEIWEDLLMKRNRAIEIESSRENFLTKHCNIIYQGEGTENFVPIDEVKKCKVDHIDFEGKQVYIGVDLALSNDNCAVAMSFEEDGEIYSDIIAFIPEGRIEEKNRFEHLNYYDFIKTMKCIACGDLTVDYSVIENFVFQIEERYKCKIMSIGYDRFNALSSAQKWNEKYVTVEIKQHSSVLHPPTKLLYEFILNKQWHYTENKLLEINFENAKCTFDTNMNRYINKKKSNGKIDMVVALINSVYLLQQDVLLYDNDFVIQVV